MCDFGYPSVAILESMSPNYDFGRWEIKNVGHSRGAD